MSADNFGYYTSIDYKEQLYVAYVFTESTFMILVFKCFSNIHQSLNFREKFVEEYHTPTQSYVNFVCNASEKMTCNYII